MMSPFARVYMLCIPGVGGAGGSGGDGGARETVGLMEGPASEVARDTGASRKVESGAMSLWTDEGMVASPSGC
jgi:hypothetical protein